MDRDLQSASLPPSSSLSPSTSAKSRIPNIIIKHGVDPTTRTNTNINERTNAKFLVEIPLLQPPIQCSNLEDLKSTSFVNIVHESVGSSNESSKSYFRVSDEKNNEMCRVQQNRIKKGIEYLECCDSTGNCIMLIAYPIGLGEVALLSPKEELLGECQSNVGFMCLTLKVKYNFYDVNGNRLMKMTGLLREEGNEKKFILIVKRSKNEKLALIKMGCLKTCCHIKFKQGQTSVSERLQIIALWIGFMHNELKDTETPALLERQAALKLERKESRKMKSPPQPITDAKLEQSSKQTHEASSPNPPPAREEIIHVSPIENANSATKNSVKWKVKSRFSPSKHKRQYQVNNNEGEEKSRLKS